MEDNCWEVIEISRSSAVLGISFLKLFIGPIGIIFLSWDIYSTKLRWMANANAKIIFFSHCLNTIQATSMLTYTYAHDIFRYLYPIEDPCDRRLASPWAYYALTFYSACDFSQLLSLLCLALERLFASLRPGTYEKIKSYWFGLVLSLASFIGGISITFGMLTPGLNFEEFVPVFKNVYPENRERYLLLKHIEFACELITLVIFIFVYIFNKRSMSAKFSLTLGSSYQKKENRKIIEILCPVFVAQFIIYTLNHFGLSIVQSFASTVENRNFLYFYLTGEYVSWTSLYPIIMPVILRVTLERRNRRQVENVHVQKQNVFVPLDQLFQQSKVLCSTKKCLSL